MHNFCCKTWTVTAILFRKLPYKMANDKLMTMLSAKIEEEKLSKYKKTDPLFSYFEGQMYLYLSVYLYFYVTVL